jgi:formylglycine-generating enzyme required for sulfatase activity
MAVLRCLVCSLLLLEVGSRPAGRYGLFDMIGNVEEWVADW